MKKKRKSGQYVKGDEILVGNWQLAVDCRPEDSLIVFIS